MYPIALIIDVSPTGNLRDFSYIFRNKAKKAQMDFNNILQRIDAGANFDDIRADLGQMRMQAAMNGARDGEGHDQV